MPDAAVYTDYRRLLENKDIDAVVVATPDHWHGRIGLDALLAGKHLYIEKPMTRRLDEAFKIYDAAKETGLTCRSARRAAATPKYLRARELVKRRGDGQAALGAGQLLPQQPQR